MERLRLVVTVALLLTLAGPLLWAASIGQQATVGMAVVYGVALAAPARKGWCLGRVLLRVAWWSLARRTA